VIVFERSAPAGKTDGGDETGRRIGSKSGSDKAARGYANRNHAGRVEVRPVRQEFEGHFEVSGPGKS